MRRRVGEEVEKGVVGAKVVGVEVVGAKVVGVEVVGAKVVGVEVVGGGSHVVTACRNWNKDTCNGIIWR